MDTKHTNYDPKGNVTEKVFTVSELNHGTLGRELKLSPKTHVYINGEDTHIKFYGPTVDVMIGIGKDNTAHLVMSVEAWEAFKAGEALSIETLKQYKNSFIK